VGRERDEEEDMKIGMSVTVRLRLTGETRRESVPVEAKFALRGMAKYYAEMLVGALHEGLERYDVNVSAISVTHPGNKAWVSFEVTVPRYVAREVADLDQLCDVLPEVTQLAEAADLARAQTWRDSTTTLRGVKIEVLEAVARVNSAV
jgi:hypothetical protein